VPSLREAVYVGVSAESVVMAALGLIILALGGLSMELYIGLGLPVFTEVVVRFAARRSAALFAEPFDARHVGPTRCRGMG
jgi:hypothetical protein